MKKYIIGGLMTTLLSTSALAHTNSIGYVGDGTGGLNFWYGSWHDGTTFNEAEIKIIHPDGTTSIDAFNLLEQDSPAGLISGVNFFSSDGSQLQPYDVNNWGGESYTWQGINYQNLVTGQYTFIYIPLGDVESSWPTASPTADWDPMDQVIRSLTINLTNGDLTGDANNNGVLDILEVVSGSASGGPTGPTVVNQGSSQVVGYIATSNGVIQVVRRTQTDTTWDNMSDGTIQNTVSTVTELEDWIGQVDQVASDSSKVQSVRFKTGVIGFEDEVTHLGLAKTLENGATIGFGHSFSDDVTKTGISIENNNIKAYVAKVSATYSYDRTIGDWNNSGATKESGFELGISYEPNNQGVSPILGAVLERSTVKGWSESGNPQSALSFNSFENNYTIGTLGVEYNKGDNSFGAKYYSNKELEISTSLDKLNLSISRDLNSNENKIGFSVTTKF